MRKLLLLLTILIIAPAAKAQLIKNYTEGAYYDLAGKKISGLLKFEPFGDKILFKAENGASSEKIDIENIKAVVLLGTNPDSVIVMTDEENDQKKYFAKPLLATPVTHFFYKFKFIHWGGGPSMVIGAAPNMGSTGSQPAFHNTYSFVPGPAYRTSKSIPMYQDGNTTYELTKKNFIAVLSKAFADVPELADRIKNNEYKFKDLQELMDKYYALTKYTGN